MWVPRDTGALLTPRAAQSIQEQGSQGGGAVLVSGPLIPPQSLSSEVKASDTARGVKLPLRLFPD